MLDTIIHLDVGEIFCIILVSFGCCACVSLTASCLYVNYLDREDKENRRIRRLIEKQKLLNELDELSKRKD